LHWLGFGWISSRILCTLYSIAIQEKSLEIDIKQIRLQAKEEAQSIIEKAEHKSEEILKEVKVKESKKEE